MREHAPVTAVEPAGDHVVVSLAEETLEAAAVIVTAGPWSPGVLQPLGIELDVNATRETLLYFTLPVAGTLPSLIDPSCPSRVDFPSRCRSACSHCVGAHQWGHGGSRRGGSARSAVVDWTSDWVARRYRDVEPRPLSADTCF